MKAVQRFFLYLSAASFAALTTVTLYEVVARYVFGSPTNWSLEVSSLLLCYGSLGALVHATWERAHIRVDLLYSRMTDASQRRVDAAGSLAFVAIMVVVAWLALLELLRAIRYDDRQTGDLGLPMWTTLGTIPLLAIALAALVLHHTIRAHRRRHAPPPGSES